MKKITIIIILLLLKQTSANSQIISGTVTDENKIILPYTNVGIIGLDEGTISSSNGSYSIDISNIPNKKILRFSYIGFESINYKIGDLKLNKISTLNITLKKKTLQLNEIVIKPNSEAPLYIGAKKRGRMAWTWSKSIKGAEIGRLFKIDKPVYLDKLFFHIRRNYCDSIYYRLRIYDGNDRLPTRIINNEDIKFISKIQKGWESIDISNYNIKVETNFIITLETLESWTSGEYQSTHLSISSKWGNSYSRESSMSKWTEFANEMSFKIEISE